MRVIRPKLPAVRGCRGSGALSHVHHHHPDGRRENVQTPHLNHRPICANASPPITTILVHHHHGQDLDLVTPLNKVYAHFFDPDAIYDYGKYRGALSRHFCVGDEVDIAIRLQPALRQYHAEGNNCVLAYVKLWLYAFASIQAAQLDPEALFGIVPGAAATTAPQLEDSSRTHAAFDAATQERPDPCDCVYVGERFDGDELSMLVDAISPFPRYTIVDAGPDLTVRALKVSIHGGRLLYCARQLPANWAWAERRKLPEYPQYVRFIHRMATRLGDQDAAVEAMLLAANLAFGFDAQSGASQQLPPDHTQQGWPAEFAAGV